MIHDVTIPFSFDTSPIEAQIANIGAQKVESIIREVTMNGIYSVMPSKRRNYYHANQPHNDSDVDWKAYVDERMDAWVDSHREEIVDEAALLMAMRVSRSTKWREILKELKAERDAE